MNYCLKCTSSNEFILIAILLLIVEDLLEKFEFYGGIKTLLSILIKTLDSDAQRFSSLALANVASYSKLICTVD